MSKMSFLIIPAKNSRIFYFNLLFFSPFKVFEGFKTAFNHLASEADKSRFRAARL